MYVLSCKRMDTNIIFAYGASLISIAILAVLAQVDGVSLNSGNLTSVRPCHSNSILNYTSTTTIPKIMLHATQRSTKNHNFKTESEEESNGETFIMFIDNEKASQREVIVHQDTVTVACFKKRNRDGRYSAIHAFVNDEEVAEDQLLFITLSDAHEISFLLNFDLQSDIPEDKTKVVKCTMTFNGDKEEITTTIVSAGTETTIVEARPMTYDYKPNELVEISCITDGNPPPPMDIAIYSTDCTNVEIPQPLMLVTARSCYVTPPACAQCFVHQDSKERKAGKKSIHSDFLVLRTESATSMALGRSGPGILIYLLIIWVGIIRPIMNTM